MTPHKALCINEVKTTTGQELWRSRGNDPHCRRTPDLPSLWTRRSRPFAPAVIRHALSALLIAMVIDTDYTRIGENTFLRVSYAIGRENYRYSFPSCSVPVAAARRSASSARRTSANRSVSPFFIIIDPCPFLLVFTSRTNSTCKYAVVRDSCCQLRGNRHGESKQRHGN